MKGVKQPEMIISLHWSKLEILRTNSSFIKAGARTEASCINLLPRVPPNWELFMASSILRFCGCICYAHVVLLAGTYYVESGSHCLALNLQVLAKVQSGLRLLSQVNLAGSSKQVNLAAGSSKLPTKTGAHKLYIYCIILIWSLKLNWGGKRNNWKSKI